MSLEERDSYSAPVAAKAIGKLQDSQDEASNRVGLERLDNSTPKEMVIFIEDG